MQVCVKLRTIWALVLSQVSDGTFSIAMAVMSLIFLLRRPWLGGVPPWWRSKVASRMGRDASAWDDGFDFSTASA